MVWFFPKESYKELENKFKKWGKKTNYGRDVGEGPDQKKWMNMEMCSATSSSAPTMR